MGIVSVVADPNIRCWADVQLDAPAGGQPPTCQSIGIVPLGLCPKHTLEVLGPEQSARYGITKERVNAPAFNYQEHARRWGVLGETESQE